MSHRYMKQGASELRLLTAFMTLFDDLCWDVDCLTDQQSTFY